MSKGGSHQLKRRLKLHSKYGKRIIRLYRCKGLSYLCLGLTLSLGFALVMIGRVGQCSDPDCPQRKRLAFIVIPPVISCLVAGYVVSLVLFCHYRRKLYAWMRKKRLTFTDVNFTDREDGYCDCLC